LKREQVDCARPSPRTARRGKKSPNATREYRYYARNLRNQPRGRGWTFSDRRAQSASIFFGFYESILKLYREAAYASTSLRPVDRAQASGTARQPSRKFSMTPAAISAEKGVEN